MDQPEYVRYLAGDESDYPEEDEEDEPEDDDEDDDDDGPLGDPEPA